MRVDIQGDFWKFNVVARNWTQLPTGPSGRSHHCVDISPSLNLLILFGGSQNGGSILVNDLWVYQMNSSQWRLETIQSQTEDDVRQPVARRGHACASHSNHSVFYLHGGNNVTVTYDDLWQYDFMLRQWSILDSGDQRMQIEGHYMRHLGIDLNSLVIIQGRLGTGKNNRQFLCFSLGELGGGEWKVVRRSLPTISNYFDGSYSARGFNPKTLEFFTFGSSSTICIHLF
jgi:hypothetical protein